MGITRKAIIIGAPGKLGDIDYLPGVERDIETYFNYFLSATGGDWGESEIVRYRNSNSKVIKNDIATTSVDFSVTIFCGHGGYLKSGDNDIILFLSHDDVLNLSDLVTKSKKQLIIIDACRTLIKTSLDDGFTIEEKFYNFTGSETRHLYDQHISKCENGIIVIYSCSKNEGAGEDKNGGFYSRAIVKAGADYKTKLADNNILDIRQAFHLSLVNIKRFPTNQTPEFNGGRRLYYFPFAVNPYLRM